MLFHLFSLPFPAVKSDFSSVLVDAAAAPRSMGGMPNVGTMKAAAKQVILAVEEEAADSVR